jgi:hypothetical protein
METIGILKEATSALTNRQHKRCEEIMKGYTLVLCALLALGAYAKAETSVTTNITPEPDTTNTTTVTRHDDTTIHKSTSSDGVTTTTTIKRDGNTITTKTNRSDAVYDTTGRAFGK